MTRSKAAALFLVGAAFAPAGLLLAQQPAAAPPPASSSSNAVPSASQAQPAPSADTVRKAREAGFKPETRDGVTKFCFKSADTGTHFETKKCYDEAQIASIIDQRQQQRDALKRGFENNPSGGALGGGH